MKLDGSKHNFTWQLNISINVCGGRVPNVDDNSWSKMGVDVVAMGSMFEYGEKQR